MTLIQLVTALNDMALWPRIYLLPVHLHAIQFFDDVRS